MNKKSRILRIHIEFLWNHFNKFIFSIHRTVYWPFTFAFIYGFIEYTNTLIYILNF